MIPRSVDEEQIEKSLKAINRGVKNRDLQARYENYEHVVTAPHSMSERIKQMFKQNKKTQAVMGCIDICSEQTPSNQLATIYDRQSSESKRFCAECMEDLLINAVGRFILKRESGVEEAELDMTQLLLSDTALSSILGTLSVENDEKDIAPWPKVPLGQFVWQVVQDGVLGKLARAWVTAAAVQALRTHPNQITMCPDHPQMLYFTGADVSCRLCHKVYCVECMAWHGRGCPKDVWLGKRCPSCHVPGVKEEGCNRITCSRCGKHWCYACEISPVFDTFTDCYSHLSQVHGGYY
jgi:hypothetical protein